MVRIAIGILAWNEAERIGATIRSLSRQSVFSAAQDEIESVDLVCVCNGCTDDTADVARRAFDEELPVQRKRLHVTVHETPLADKVAAWNAFVHRLSDSRADYLVLVDSDVELPNANALMSLVDILQGNSRAHIAAGTPVKRAALRRQPSIRERLSLAFSRISQTASPTFICGMLYAGRARFLRSISLPRGMLGEDSFLMVMAITSLYTTDPDYERIVHPTDAVVIYEPYLQLSTLARQHKRRVIARHIDQLLLEYLETRCDGEDAGEVLNRCNTSDHAWLVRLVNEKVAAQGRFVLPLHVITLRFHEIRAIGLRGLGRLPLAIAELPLKIAVYLAANRALKCGDFAAAWRDVRDGHRLSDTDDACGEPVPAPANRAG